jgi:hypothetical protein
MAGRSQMVQTQGSIALSATPLVCHLSNNIGNRIEPFWGNQEYTKPVRNFPDFLATETGNAALIRCPYGHVEIQIELPLHCWNTEHAALAQAEKMQRRHPAA